MKLFDRAEMPALYCRWCGGELTLDRADEQTCGRKCRQSAFRIRKRQVNLSPSDRPLRVAYADPPYPGLSAKYYRHEPSYAGEVDHRQLLASLVDRYDGWALSTGAYALREILPLCPPDVRVCAWCKCKGVSGKTRGIHNSWEPLIVLPARRLRPGKRDYLIAHTARGGGHLMGRKPIAFCSWLFSLLGMLPGDDFVDLFPGSGIVSRCWEEVSRYGR